MYSSSMIRSSVSSAKSEEYRFIYVTYFVVITSCYSLVYLCYFANFFRIFNVSDIGQNVFPTVANPFRAYPSQSMTFYSMASQHRDWKGKQQNSQPPPYLIFLSTRKLTVGELGNGPTAVAPRHVISLRHRLFPLQHFPDYLRSDVFHPTSPCHEMVSMIGATADHSTTRSILIIYEYNIPAFHLSISGRRYFSSSA